MGLGLGLLSGLGSLAGSATTAAGAMQQGQLQGKQMLLSQYIAQQKAQREGELSAAHSAYYLSQMGPNGARLVPDGEDLEPGEVLLPSGGGPRVAYNPTRSKAGVTGAARVQGIGMQQDGATTRTGMQQDGANGRTAATVAGHLQGIGMQQSGATQRTGMQQSGANARNANTVSGALAGRRIAAGMPEDGSQPSVAGGAPPVIGGVRGFNASSKLTHDYQKDDAISRAAEVNAGASRLRNGLAMMRQHRPEGATLVMEGLAALTHKGIPRKADKSFILEAQGLADRVQAEGSRISGTGAQFSPDTQRAIEQMAGKIVQGAAQESAAATQRHLARGRQFGVSTDLVHDPLEDEAKMWGAPTAASIAGAHPASAGAHGSAADRWEALVQSGVPKDKATAQVKQEFGAGGH